MTATIPVGIRINIQTSTFKNHPFRIQLEIMLICGLKSNQILVVTPINVMLLLQQHTLQAVSIVGPRICNIPFGSMQSTFQYHKYQSLGMKALGASSTSLCSVSYIGFVFINRILSSVYGEQTIALAIVSVVWGFLWSPFCQKLDQM